jgi:hypothetical protein
VCWSVSEGHSCSSLSSSPQTEWRWTCSQEPRGACCRSVSVQTLPS